eukprot:365411-Chlamydomonas_euryale.AAC.2
MQIHAQAGSASRQRPSAPPHAPSSCAPNVWQQTIIREQRTHTNAFLAHLARLDPRCVSTHLAKHGVEHAAEVVERQRPGCGVSGRRSEVHVEKRRGLRCK